MKGQVGGSGRKSRETQAWCFWSELWQGQAILQNLSAEESSFISWIKLLGGKGLRGTASVWCVADGA